MKILVILGTRPNFIKHYAFQEGCQRHGIECVTAHTGQHYDDNMSRIFFEELGILPPHYLLDLKKSTPAGELSDMIQFLERVIFQERPDVTLLYGDVTSTMAGALASSRLGVPVAHVEAGVHTLSRFNPEELNRRVTEACTHTFFPHIEDARQNLLAAGVPEQDILLTGDIVMDSLLLAMKSNHIEVEDKGYLFVTMHRAENTDDPARMAAICRALIEQPRPVRFPIHPRTRQALQRSGLLAELEAASHLELLPSLSYLESIRLLAGAHRVLSDSGGVRREAYILGKPVISLIEMVWVPAMVQCGWEWIAGADPEKIRQGLDSFTPPTHRPDIFGDGRAVDRMLAFLQQRYGKDATHKQHPVTGFHNQHSLVAAALHHQSSNSPTLIRSSVLRTLISLVIPCYNEEETLPTLFYRLHDLEMLIDAQRYRLQFVLVDDGSSDNTWEMLNRKFGRDAMVKLVRNPVNLGYGGALKVGLNAADGEFIVTVDADTNYDLRESPRLLDALVESGADFVTASPFMDEGTWNYPVHRFMFSRSVVVMYRHLLGPCAGDIVTFTCGFRAYRKACLPAIMPEANDFLANAEIQVRALLKGLRVVQVPAIVYERKYGQSKLKTLRTIRSHLGLMWRMRRGEVGVSSAK